MDLSQFNTGKEKDLRMLIYYIYKVLILLIFKYINTTIFLLIGNNVKNKSDATHPVFPKPPRTKKEIFNNIINSTNNKELNSIYSISPDKEMEKKNR